MHLSLDYFNGFPYMLTDVEGGLLHIAILPADAELANLKEIVRWQVGANKLNSCLVLSPACCIHFDLTGREQVSGQIPRGGVNCSGRLYLCQQLTRSNEMLARAELLQSYVDQNGATDFVCADLSKGGHRPTREEVLRLRGRQPSGVPVGLTMCDKCGEWRGQSLDPDPKFAGLVMNVVCRCENDSLCAACGQPLAERRINANYYDELSRRIVHVPGFKAFDHECAAEPGCAQGEAGEEEITGGIGSRRALLGGTNGRQGVSQQVPSDTPRHASRSHNRP
jgi:hypothetical protein